MSAILGILQHIHFWYRGQCQSPTELDVDRQQGATLNRTIAHVGASGWQLDVWQKSGLDITGLQVQELVFGPQVQVTNCLRRMPLTGRVAKGIRVDSYFRQRELRNQAAPDSKDLLCNGACCNNSAPS